MVLSQCRKPAKLAGKRLTSVQPSTRDTPHGPGRGLRATGYRAIPDAIVPPRPRRTDDCSVSH
jgi:hypothetical protein